MKNSRPTPVRVGIMERKRPELVSILPIRHLSLFERVLRAGKRSLIVMGVLVLLGNVAFILMPIPHVHLCSIPLAILLGPVVAIFTFRTRVLLASAQVQCPKCATPVTVPEKLGGWPARFNCPHCAIMIELSAAR